MVDTLLSSLHATLAYRFLMVTPELGDSTRLTRRYFTIPSVRWNGTFSGHFETIATQVLVVFSIQSPLISVGVPKKGACTLEACSFKLCRIPNSEGNES